MPYLAHRLAGLARFDALCAQLEPWAGSRERAAKRAYVDQVRGFLTANAAYAEAWWFPVAMRLFDYDAADARIIVDAQLLDEPVPELRKWRLDPGAEVRAILTAPVREEDG